MASAGTAALWACRQDSLAGPAASATRLLARPGVPNILGTEGRTTFDVQASSAVVHVPSSVKRTAPAPLLLYLHGAFREADAAVSSLQHAADQAGVIVLAPYATAGTWDAIKDVFGDDIRVIDDALRWVFERWSVRTDHIVLTGFSDGATYALAVGRANGDLFRRVVAYSPGILLPVAPNGRPDFLITHGTADQVLPIDQCSRVIVPQLLALGYTVDYREFDGPHMIAPGVPEEVMAALAAP